MVSFFHSFGPGAIHEGFQILATPGDPGVNGLAFSSARTTCSIKGQQLVLKAVWKLAIRVNPPFSLEEVLPRCPCSGGQERALVYTTISTIDLLREFSHVAGFPGLSWHLYNHP
jgi:hypothetical protein